MRRICSWLTLAASMVAIAPPVSAEGGASARVPSPCGRHLLEVVRGVVLVDGRAVSARGVQVLGVPTWRADGRAVAWVERSSGLARLVVLPEVGHRAEPMPQPLPRVAPRDRVFWAGRTRVVVGPRLLEPRAVISWTETEI